MKLPIILCEGLGDCALLLGLVPHQALSRLGFRFDAFYTSPPEVSPHYRMAKPLVVDLIKAIPHFDYQDREPTVMERRLWTVLRKIFRRRSIYVSAAKPKSLGATVWRAIQTVLGCKAVYPTRVDCPETDAIFGRPTQAVRVLLHTHLDTGFAPFKSWGVENWLSAIGRLRELNAPGSLEIWILEFNQEAVARITSQFPDVRVVNAALKSFSKVVASVRYFDVLVAVDSWTKYVGNWSGVECVIMVPSHIGKNIWADLTAEHLLNWYFNGIYGARHVDVLGIAVEDDQARYTLNDLRDLPPEVLVARIQRKIECRRYFPVHREVPVPVGAGAEVSA